MVFIWIVGHLLVTVHRLFSVTFLPIYYRKPYSKWIRGGFEDLGAAQELGWIPDDGGDDRTPSQTPFSGRARPLSYSIGSGYEVGRRSSLERVGEVSCATPSPNVYIL